MLQGLQFHFPSSSHYPRLKPATHLRIVEWSESPAIQITAVILGGESLLLERHLKSKGAAQYSSSNQFPHSIPPPQVTVASHSLKLTTSATFTMPISTSDPESTTKPLSSLFSSLSRVDSPRPRDEGEVMIDLSLLCDTNATGVIVSFNGYLPESFTPLGQRTPYWTPAGTFQDKT
ncbi:hypothetical protein WG66_011339 [Moniliophthora roreri]|nr:hypothetical protein WG66_011339 [Moniliophthora roreri]